MHGQIGCKQGARGNLGGGGEEGTMGIQWKEKQYPNFNRTELSDWVAAVLVLEPTPPNNEQAIWSQYPDQKKRHHILFIVVFLVAILLYQTWEDDTAKNQFNVIPHKLSQLKIMEEGQG